MKIIKALFLRFLHCFVETYIYFDTETDHRMVTYLTTTRLRFIHIPIWRKYHYIKCMCGKSFYTSEEYKSAMKILKDL